jgi:hypothetical protein
LCGLGGDAQPLLTIPQRLIGTLELGDVTALGHEKDHLTCVVADGCDGEVEAEHLAGRTGEEELVANDGSGDGAFHGLTDARRHTRSVGEPGALPEGAADDVVE